jgi:predicted permease
VTGTPRWPRRLLSWLAPDGVADDVLGDLEEARRRRSGAHGPVAAGALLALDALDMIVALVRTRVRELRHTGGTFVHDYKLGFRMLLKYPGLTLAGGLALAIAIGIGAGWYDLSRDILRPAIPLAGADRIVEVEMRDSASAQDERRLLHDFVAWRRQAHFIEDLGAYRTLDTNIVFQDPGGVRAEPIRVAEISASAFRVARVAPLLGRPLLEADEAPGAPPVVVLGYAAWQRQFGGRADIVGHMLRFGSVAATVVGVMPEGFAFPVNHRMWVPLQLRTSGYAPLDGPPVRVFGRLAAGATQAQAYAEVTALTEREAAASPGTHQYLRPRVLAYGGESPGDRFGFEMLLTHVPILLVLIVACVNVGTLIYARTATRDREIATRYALGASRSRIVMQLFVEALVLAGCAAAAGLLVANAALKWGVNAYYSGQDGQLPFWIHPGLKPTTVVYAIGMTIAGGCILGILPALKATGTHAHAQLKTLGAGGSTLRFGWIWTTAMIAQVALTVICIPPAMGISQEALRDHRVRAQFPAGQYLAARIDLDQSLDESPEAFARRRQLTYEELERRVSQEPGVRAVTFGDRLPGMSVAVRRAEFEPAPGATLVSIGTLWTAKVGPRFFESFDVPVVQGRGFHEGDRTPNAAVALVNEAFARQYLDGANPIGRRVRFAAATAQAQPERWLEIVGMVRDVGMTPTDLGEAAYLYTPASAATTSPLVMGVRAGGDPSALAPRLRAVAAAVDPGLRVDEVRTLDALAWRIDVPQMVAAGAIAFVVALGLFLSAAGIFSLMSVNVARRTREIGLRTALGASPQRLLLGIFTRALTLVGSGIAAGNGVLLLIVALSPEIELAQVVKALAGTSSVMLIVGLLACLEPARRALRIAPTDALKEA